MIAAIYEEETDQNVADEATDADQAAVVCRIFALCAEGQGFPT